MDNKQYEVNTGMFQARIKLSPELLGLLAIRHPDVVKLTQEVLDEVAEEGKEMIQSDTPVRTGTLRNSIKVRPADSQNDDMLPAAQIYADTDEAPYANIVEFGSDKQGRQGAYMFTKNIPNIVRLVRQRLTNRLNAYLGRKKGR